MASGKLPTAHKPSDGALQLVAGIESKILSIRGQRVLLSSDLAVLYGVEPRVLMQSVNRNLDRFPPDFAFALTQQEMASLKSQFVTSSWGGARKPPTAFTEQGVAMLSSVLRSPEAIAVNVQIMRAFVKLRSLLAEHQDLKMQLADLERKYDGHFKTVFEAIRELMTPPEPVKKRRIGFIQDE
jgi:ORF6N domain